MFICRYCGITGDLIRFSSDKTVCIACADEHKHKGGSNIWNVLHKQYGERGKYKRSFEKVKKKDS